MTEVHSVFDGKQVGESIEAFSMRNLALLSQGAVTTQLLKSKNLSVTAKVYCGGGENDLHRHSEQDHAFFVLAGSATFFDAAGGTIDVGPLEGIMIPRGVDYMFHSNGEPENLVMLRMAGAVERYAALRETHVAADGTVQPGKDPSTGGSRGRPGIGSGEFFGVDGQYLKDAAATS